MKHDCKHLLQVGYIVGLHEIHKSVIRKANRVGTRIKYYYENKKNEFKTIDVSLCFWNDFHGL